LKKVRKAKKKVVNDFDEIEMQKKTNKVG